MRMSIALILRAMEKHCPAPGSINWDNAQEIIEVPIYTSIGLICYVDPKEPSGMGGGSAERIGQLAFTLKFVKNKTTKAWDIDIPFEHAEEFERLNSLVWDLKSKLEEREPGTVRKPRRKKS